MGVGKEIRTQIASIRSTQKITSAMQMVAASKMRKTQDRMVASRPYSERIRTVIDNLVHSTPEYQHLYMKERQVRRVCFIVLGTDRGLCGGLNQNLFKQVEKQMHEWEAQGIEVDIFAAGRKSIGFFKARGANIVASRTPLQEKPSLEDVIAAVKVTIDSYKEERIDRLYIAHNRYVNTMTQKPTIEQLLPLSEPEQSKIRKGDYIYEPESRELLDGLLTRYLEVISYQGVLENNACEQAARMIAMRSATDNAGELINELELVYNKQRQGAITQELSEIVSGAAAV